MAISSLDKPREITVRDFVRQYPVVNRHVHSDGVGLLLGNYNGHVCKEYGCIEDKNVGRQNEAYAACERRLRGS